MYLVLHKVEVLLMYEWLVRLKGRLLGYIQPVRIIENKVFINKPLVLDGRPTIVRDCRFHGCGIIHN